MIIVPPLFAAKFGSTVNIIIQVYYLPSAMSAADITSLLLFSSLVNNNYCFVQLIAYYDIIMSYNTAEIEFWCSYSNIDFVLFQGEGGGVGSSKTVYFNQYNTITVYTKG